MTGSLELEVTTLNGPDESHEYRRPATLNSAFLIAAYEAERAGVVRIQVFADGKTLMRYDKDGFDL